MKGTEENMRALVQRCQNAKVVVDGENIGEIGSGLLILLGIQSSDSKETCVKLWRKIHNLRIFADEKGKTNLDISQTGGNALIVSQFTLYADTSHGNRPSFIAAANYAQGKEIYEAFLACAKKDLPDVQHGSFGADMKVHLVNDGPFTIWLDTADF